MIHSPACIRTIKSYITQYCTFPAPPQLHTVHTVCFNLHTKVLRHTSQLHNNAIQAQSMPSCMQDVPDAPICN